MKTTALLFVIAGLLVAIAAAYCSFKNIPNTIYISTSMMFICIGMMFNIIGNKTKNSP